MSTPSAPTLLKCLSEGRAAEVTVVVPTRNAARTLAACLDSLRSQSEQCVVVVVDNHSDDETQAIARRLADIVAVAGPERSAQRNLGAALAPAPFLGFIDADMVVGREVVAEAVAALRLGAGAVIVPERSFGEGFWAEVRAFERSFYVGSDSVEAARFFRRGVFEEAGSFDAGGLPGGEDWDLTGRVRQLAPVERVTAMIEHDEGRPTLLDLWRKKAYYGPGLRGYVGTHGTSSLGALDRPYLRRPTLLLSRGPRLGAGLVLLKTGEAVAAGIGMLQNARWRPLPRTAISRAADGIPAGQGALPRAVAVVSFGPVLQPNSGLPVRANTTVRSLAGLGIRVSLVSTSAETRTGRDGEPETIHALRRPLRLGFSLELVRVVRALAREVDCIVVESALLLPAVLLGRRGLPVVWDTNECETLHYSRLPRRPAVLARLGAWWMLEQLAARSSAAVVAISEAEAVYWGAYFPACRDKVVVVPHAPAKRATQPPPEDTGADQRGLLALSAPTEQAIPPSIRTSSDCRLVFLGATVGKHNAVAAKWLVTTLAPLLPANTSLVLVGEGTDRVVERFASSQTIACTVVGLGFVSDVDAVIEAADLCLAPLASGAGVKTKVLHYLAHGKPVVGTPAAFEGIAGAPGTISVPLDALPRAVLDAIGQEQGDEERAALATAQARWLDAHHGEEVVSAAWDLVLRTFPSFRSSRRSRVGLSLRDGHSPWSDSGRNQLPPPRPAPPRAGWSTLPTWLAGAKSPKGDHRLTGSSSHDLSITHLDRARTLLADQPLSITFVVPAYGEGAGIRPTLESLWGGITEIAPAYVDIFISDSSPNTDTVTAAREWANLSGATLRIDRSEQRRSLKQALNVALDAISADIAVFVVSDVVVPPASLAALLLTMLTEPQPDVAVGVAMPDPAASGLRYRAGRFQLRAVADEARRKGGEMRAEGALWAARRSFYEQFRFAESAGSVADDIELSRAVKQRGFLGKTSDDAIVLKIPGAIPRDFCLQTLRFYYATGQSGDMHRTLASYDTFLRSAFKDPIGALAYGFARFWCLAFGSRYAAAVQTEFWDPALSTKR